MPWSIPLGTLLPLRSVANDITIRVLGERDQPLARATVVIDGGGIPAQALTDDNGIARLTFFGGPVDAVRAVFVGRLQEVCAEERNHGDRVKVGSEEREDYRKTGCLEAEVAASGIVRRLIWRVKSGDRSRAVDLRERNQRLDHAPQLLRLRERRADRLVPQERHRHVAHQRLPVRAVARELTAGESVTHG